MTKDTVRLLCTWSPWTSGLLMWGQEGNTSTHIFAMCNGFEMIRIDTSSISAKMVKLKTLTYRTEKVQIGPPMSIDRFSINSHLPITCCGFGSKPNPTAPIVRFVTGSEILHNGGKSSFTSRLSDHTNLPEN